MRHKKLNKRFGRNRSARKELMRSLARNAIMHSSIKTTLAKAKQASRFLDKLITIAKKQNLQARRAAFDVLQDKTLVSILVDKLAPLFKDRKGGYTRVIRLNTRHGDGCQMALLELVEKLKKEPKPKKGKKPKQAQEKPAEAQKQDLERTKQELPKAEKALKPAEEKKPPKKAEAKPPEKEKPPVKIRQKQEPKKDGLFGKIKGMFRKKAM